MPENRKVSVHEIYIAKSYFSLSNHYCVDERHVELFSPVKQQDAVTFSNFLKEGKFIYIYIYIYAAKSLERLY